METREFFTLIDEIEIMMKELFTRVKEGEHKKSADMLEGMLFKMKRAQLLSGDILKTDKTKVGSIIEKIKRASSMLKILRRYYEIVSTIELEANMQAVKEIKRGSIINRAE